MDRRTFLQSSLSAAGLQAIGAASSTLALAAQPAAASYRNLLVLIELQGGNDGLNTVVPYADPTYYALRPKLAIARDDVVQLSDRAGLHPALSPLLPLWKDGQLAVLQGIGYPAPNLSHFRSIEIWDTASRSGQYLREGWLTRAFAAKPVPSSFGADGVIIGSADLGPLDGGARAVALANPDAKIVFRDTVCQPTKDRQLALEKLLDEVDAMVIVGGHNSNNTRKLAERRLEWVGDMSRKVSDHGLRRRSTQPRPGSLRPKTKFRG